MFEKKQDETSVKTMDEMAEEEVFFDLLGDLATEVDRFADKLELLRNKVLKGTFDKNRDPVRATVTRASQDLSEGLKEYRGFKFTRLDKKKKE